MSITQAEYFSIEDNFAQGVADAISSYVSMPVFSGRTQQQLPDSRIEVFVAQCDLASNQPFVAGAVTFYGHYNISLRITIRCPRHEDINIGKEVGAIRVALSPHTASLDETLVTMKTLNLEEVSTSWRQEGNEDIAISTYSAEVALLPEQFPTS